MDFRMTPAQETKRKEFYKVCAELYQKKPASYQRHRSPSTIVMRAGIFTCTAPASSASGDG